MKDARGARRLRAVVGGASAGGRRQSSTGSGSTRRWPRRPVEFAPGSGSETDQGSFVEIVVRGTLMHTNVDYDGKNVLEVKAGKAEAATS